MSNTVRYIHEDMIDMFAEVYGVGVGWRWGVLYDCWGERRLEGKRYVRDNRLVRTLINSKFQMFACKEMMLVRNELLKILNIISKLLRKSSTSKSSYFYV